VPKGANFCALSNLIFNAKIKDQDQDVVTTNIKEKKEKAEKK
jgi:hypothetical protein